VLAIVHVLAVVATHRKLRGRQGRALLEQTYAASRIQPVRRRLASPASPPPITITLFQGSSSSVWRAEARPGRINIIFSALERRMRSPKTAKSSDSMRPRRAL